MTIGTAGRRLPWAVIIGGLTVMVAAAALADDEPPVPVPRVAVYDFTDRTDCAGRLAGRRAADAVACALGDAGRWEVVDRGRLLRECGREQLRPPLGVGYLQMLGDRLGAPLALTGRVEVCALNRRRGAAQVTLVAELLETLGGGSLASVRGVASARRTEEPAALGEILDRALVGAAAEVVSALSRFEPTSAPVTTVLPDGRAMLDGPEEPPLRAGDEMVVYTGEKPVAVIAVESVRLTVVHARTMAGEVPRMGGRAVLVNR